jgi:hypothetical protein
MTGGAAPAGATPRWGHHWPGKPRFVGRLPLVAIVAAAVALLAPSAAQARAPVLQSVGIGFGHATAQWSNPPGVRSIGLEISKNPATGTGGYFRELVTISVLDYTQTALTPDDCGDCVLTAGETYYLHVEGQDTKYRSCPPREWSDTMKLTVSADRQSVVAEDVGGGSPPCPKSFRGGSGAGGGGAGGSGTDVAPFFRVLSAQRAQRVGKLFVRTVVSKAATVTASATVNVPGGSAKVYRFRTVKRKVAADVRTKLRLKISKRALRTIRRALRRGRRLSAKIVLTARDSDGNTRIVRQKVRLKP